MSRKIMIYIDQRASNEFWVRKSGKHWAFKSPEDAIRHARNLQERAGGFEKAVIVDNTGKGIA